VTETRDLGKYSIYRGITVTVRKILRQEIIQKLEAENAGNCLEANLVCEIPSEGEETLSGIYIGNVVGLSGGDIRWYLLRSVFTLPRARCARPRALFMEKSRKQDEMSP